jgi:hypothetical protein
MNRTWLAGLLASALLGAWQESLLHPLEHVDEHGHFVHLNGTDGSDARGENDHEDGNPSERLGDSLAALTACAAGAPQSLRPQQPGHYSAPSAYQGAPRVAEAPPFLSQGPPASV